MRRNACAGEQLSALLRSVGRPSAGGDSAVDVQSLQSKLSRVELEKRISELSRAELIDLSKLYCRLFWMVALFDSILVVDCMVEACVMVQYVV